MTHTDTSDHSDPGTRGKHVAGPVIEAVQNLDEPREPRDRFDDPLIQEIVELWRRRQDMVRANTALTNHCKGILRRFTEGDKTEADKLWQSINNGMEHPLAEPAAIATSGLRLAMVPIVEQRAEMEKMLARLGKDLPIAHMADNIKGVNHLTLAKIVGECGDLSAYHKGIAGIWKRAGLAVIDGGRQRRVAGDAALLHGYAPDRRSVFWNIAAALLKAQGKDEAAGPYRVIYDEHKAKQLEREGITLGHAHNRALRYMTKRLLRDLWTEWKAVARGADA